MMYGCFILCRCSKGHESGSQALQGPYFTLLVQQGQGGPVSPVHHNSTESGGEPARARETLTCLLTCEEHHFVLS